MSGKPIQQIVCCGEGDPGPTIWNHLYNPVKYMDEYYKYKVNDSYGAKEEGDRKIGKQEPVNKERIFYVPKAAYYPLYETYNNRIKSIEFESKDNRELYEIMGTIWKQLGLDS